jgi:sulfate adenylyltransferase subunit 1 (EFTu-like GTPase family)
MDDPSVQWSKERFDEIEKKIIPFLKACGYNVRKDVQFLPISGLFGHNMKERMPATMCDWWDGPCLFEALDAVELPERSPNGPFRYFQFVFYHGSHFLLYRMDYPPTILPTRHDSVFSVNFFWSSYQCGQ